MSDRNLQVLLTGNASALKATLAGASRDLQTFDKQVENSGKGSSKAMQVWGLAAKAGGLVVAAAFAYSIKAAAGFEARMRNVNSISGLSEKALASLSSEVLSMSTKLPQSANELAEGLYDIASSGFQGAEGMEVLRRSAEAASAGLTTTATSAKAITAVLNAYGLEASDAGSVSDILFQAVNVGVLSFEELSGAVGDFAGTAAAAGVPIEDAAGALATMTLAGIGAAEAGTSLNRVLQSVIQPSESLSMVFEEWGFASGEAAINTLGLEGVMNKLREATGGNITTMLQLFPEIRAARGALALMSAEGQNYAGVSKAMQDADRGQGATRKALAEQMKATTAQFKLFVNWLNSVAITIGSKALPAMNDLIDGAKSVFTAIGDVVSGAVDKLSGFFEDLVSAMSDFGAAAIDVWNALKPLATLIAGLAFGALLVTLNLVGTALAFLAGVAKRVSGVLAALAIVFAVFRGYDALNNVFNTMSTALSKMGTSAGATGGKLGAMASAIGPAELGVGAFALALVVVGGAMAAAANEASKAKGSIKDFVDELKIAPGTLGSMRSGLKAMRDELASLNGEADKSNLENFAQLANPFADNSIQRSREERKLLTSETKKLDTAQENLSKNTEDLASKMGVSRDQAQKYAKSLDIDLTGSFWGEEAKAARGEVIDSFNKTRVEAGVTKDALKSFSQESIDALEAAMKAEADFVNGVRENLQSAQSVVAAFGKDGFNGSETLLKGFFDQNVKEVQDFTTNIGKAMEMGLDPGVVAEALAAGPKEAGKLIEQVVSDSSGNMVKLVNDGAAAMEAANTKLLELARINHKAVTADSSQMVADASAATRISLAAMESDAFSSAQSLADKLGLPVEEVTRVADEYGIVVDKVNGKPLDISVDATGLEQAKASMSEIQGLLSTSFKNSPEVKVAMNIDDVIQRTAELNRIALGYINSNPTTKAYLETLDAEGKAKYLSDFMAGLPGGAASGPYLLRISATVEVDPAKASLGELEDKLQAYVASDPKAISYLDTHNPEENAAFLQLLAANWAKETPKGTAYLDKLQPELTFGTLRGWANDWGNTRKEAIMTATAKTQQAEAQLALLERTRYTDIVATVTVKKYAIPEMGIAQNYAPSLGTRKTGRWGRLDHYAEGGVRQAQMGGGNNQVWWDEPQTGGEAYVPRLGKKDKSVPVLSTAASWYGYDLVRKADGGLMNGTYRPAGGGGSSGGVRMGDVNVTITGGAGGADLKKAIREELVPAIRQEARNVAKVLQEHDRSVRS